MAKLQSIDTGEVVDVPQEQVAQALASQKYTLANTPTLNSEGGAVRMIDTGTNKAVVIPREKAIAALESGNFRLREEADDYRNTAGAIKGLGMGIARGLTFNISDLALKRHGVNIEAIEQANPGLTTFGEVTGLVGGLLLPTGIAGAAGKGGKAATEAGMALKTARAATVLPRSLSSLSSFTANKVEGAIIKSLVGEAAPNIATRALARAAGVGTAGAIENVAWSAGKVISETDLGDPKAVAEALVASAGPAAIWGGGLGAAMGGTSVILGGAMRKMASTATKRLQDIADSAPAQRKVGEFAEQANYKALGITPAQASKILERKPDAFNILHDPNVLPDGPIIQPKMSQKEIATRLKQAYKASGENISKFYDEVDAMAASKSASGQLIEVPNLIDDLSELEQRLAKTYGESSGAVSAVKSFYKEVENRQLMTAKDMKNLWGQFGPKTRGYAAPGTEKWGQQDIWRLLKDHTKEALNEMSPQLLEKMQQLDGNYSTLDAMRRAVKGAARGAGAEELDTIFRRAGEVASWRGANAVGSLMRGASPGAVVGAIAGGVPGAMVGSVGSVALQQFKPAPSTVAVWAQKAAQLGMMQKQINALQSRIDSAIDKFARAASGAKVTRAAVLPVHSHVYNEVKEKDARKAARKMAERMHQLGSNPQLLMDNMATASIGIQDHAPQISQALAQTLAVAFRVTRSSADKVMPALDPLQPNLVDDKQLPSEEAARKFLRIATAVMDPIHVAERLADGTVTREEVKVLQEAYPALYALMSIQMMDKLSEINTRIPYAQRVALSMWLDKPTDRSLMPDFMARQLSALQDGQGPKKVNQPGMNDAARPSKKGLQRAEKLGQAMAPATQAVARSLAK